MTNADRDIFRVLLEAAIREGAEVTHARDWEAYQALETAGAPLCVVVRTPGAWRRFLDGARLENSILEVAQSEIDD